MAEDTTFRDELARDRTALANERTLLAYGRTSLGLVALSVFIFRFMPTSLGITIGIFSFFAALAVLFFGVYHYRIVSSKIAADAAQGNARIAIPVDLDD